MNASQQYMLDVYRAAQLGTRTPPAPGRHDWQAVAELRDTVRADLRFRAVVEGRPARTYRRAAVARLATRLTTGLAAAARALRTAASAGPRTPAAVRNAAPAIACTPRTADCN
jgi:hypothetical protein